MKYYSANLKMNKMRAQKHDFSNIRSISDIAHYRALLQKDLSNSEQILRKDWNNVRNSWNNLSLFKLGFGKAFSFFTPSRGRLFQIGLSLAPLIIKWFRRKR